jgi:photosystem II stability/assembly factor-like uncharacterized protein
VNLRSTGSLLGLALLSCSSGSTDHAPPFFLVPRWANQQRVPTASHLRAVRFNDANQGLIAGHDSSLFRTDDGGVTWIQLEHQPFNRGGDILAMDFLAREVKAVGVDAQGVGRIWTSEDAASWTTPDADGAGARFVAVDVTPSFLGAPPNVTWALREDWKIFESNSAGETFENAYLTPPGGGLKATSIDMLYNGPGYVVGDGGMIFETTSRGLPVQNAPLPAPPDPAWEARSGAGSSNLKDVQCVEAGVVFACGEGGTLVWTESGGDVAALVAGGAPAPTGTLRALHFFHTFQGTSTGWVVGDGGLIRKVTGTFTPGAPGTWTWTWAAAPSSVTTENLYDVHFVDASNGYAVGDNGVVVKTSNGGTSWTNLTKGSTDTVNAVCFDPSGVVGVAVGDNGKVYKTLNGGSLWTVTDLGAMNWTAVSIPPGNFNVAYICGPNGDIRRNLDLSALVDDWTDQGTGTPNVTLRGIHFPSSADVGFAVGDNGTILYTNTGTGLFNWLAPVKPATASNYMAVTSSLRGGGLELYAAGADGLIAESLLTNYLTWTQIAGASTWGAGETVTAFQAPLSTLLFAALDDGGGQRLHRRMVNSWLPAPSQPSPTPPTAAGLAFVGPSLGWWVGDKIYTTQNGANAGVGLNDWTVSPTHTKSTFKGIWMDPSGTVGYVVGTNGTILKTVTGGK